MRDRVTRITKEIGKLLDLQTKLIKEKTFTDLAADEIDTYHTRRNRIRQLCSDLTGLNSYNEA